MGTRAKPPSAVGKALTPTTRFFHKAPTSKAAAAYCEAAVATAAPTKPRLGTSRKSPARIVVTGTVPPSDAWRISVRRRGKFVSS